jgi:hypothetical protein
MSPCRTRSLLPLANKDVPALLHTKKSVPLHRKPFFPSAKSRPSSKKSPVRQGAHLEGGEEPSHPHVKGGAKRKADTTLCTVTIPGGSLLQEAFDLGLPRSAPLRVVQS